MEYLSIYRLFATAVTVFSQGRNGAAAIWGHLRRQLKELEAMFADTVSAEKTTRNFKWPGLSTLKRVTTGMFGKPGISCAADLPESHYRDLGLTSPRQDFADIRPLIILGPM